MASYLIPYKIVGHILVEANNRLAASSSAIRIVRTAAENLEASGENEFWCPCGDIVQPDVDPVHIETDKGLWRPGAHGYTTVKGEADIWSRAEASVIIANLGPEKQARLVRVTRTKK